MYVETALFFESPEQIYMRVFRITRPREPLPVISVRFRPFATITNRVRLTNNCLTVELSDLLQTAPAPIQEALAYILIAKLFRKTPDGGVLACYRRYLNQEAVRETIQAIKRERGRKHMDKPQGSVYNLEEIFQDLNNRYFGGAVERPILGWSRRPSRNTWGHFDPSHHAIVLNCRMDSESCAALVVRFVLFHEMLHIVHPTQHEGVRRCIHTEQFKQAEKKFELYREAKRMLRVLTAKL